MYDNRTNYVSISKLKTIIKTKKTIGKTKP